MRRILASRILGSRILGIIVAFVIVIALSGCGSDLPQTVKVRGRVTFDGNPPPGPGIVYFLPTQAEANFPTRPASGEFGADGAYTATTFEPGDGLMPGKYGVYVECYETAPNMDGKPVKSYVPQKYQSAESSGLELQITTNMSSQEYNIAVETK